MRNPVRLVLPVIAFNYIYKQVILNDQAGQVCKTNLSHITDRHKF